MKGVAKIRRKNSSRPPRGVRWVDWVLAHRVRRTESGCLEWTGFVARNGYGLAHYPGTGRRGLAHRIIYEESVGPIPAGLTIDHLCRNPICVNPQHLEPVTMRENLSRGTSVQANTIRTGRCRRGHEFSGANVAVNKNGDRSCIACRRVRYLEGRARLAKETTS